MAEGGEIGGDDWRYLSFLLGAEGVVDYDGTPMGSVFQEWPTADGIDHALEVQKSHAAKAEDEIKRRRPDWSVRLLMSDEWRQQIIAAAVEWEDHECEDSIDIMARLTRMIADELIRQSVDEEEDEEDDDE